MSHSILNLHLLNLHYTLKNNNIDNFDLFERHSQKELSDDELNKFCERLTSDDSFRNEFEEYEISATPVV